MAGSLRRKSLSAPIVASLLLLAAACSSAEERARDYVESGQSWLEQGDFPKARLEFQNALKLDPDIAEAWFGLAQIAEGRGDAARAIQTLQRVVELDKGHVEAHTKLARYMVVFNQIDRAVELSNRAYELAPENVEVMTVRAAVLFKLDDREGAVREAERILERDSNNAEATSIIAASLFADNEFEEALAVLDKGIEANDRNIGLQFLKIAALERLQDNEGVERVLLQLVELFPDEVSFRRVYVGFLLRQGRQGEAESAMRAYAEKASDDTNAQLDLVRFINQVRGADAARLELVSLIAKGGDEFRYRLALAQLDFSNARQEDAIDQLGALIADTEDSAQANTARSALARMHLARNGVNEAEQVISDILDLDEKNAEGLGLRGMLNLASGDFESAVSDLRLALGEQPGSANFTALLARAYALSGSIELADERYTIALRLSNLNPDLAIEYARFLRQQGKSDRAETIVTEAATRAPRNIPLLSTLAELRLTRGDWGGAEQLAEAIRSIEEGSNVSAEIQAAALAGQRRVEESIEVLKQAFAASGQAIRPMMSLVRTQIQAGKSQDADAFLQGVLQANPDNAEAHVLLGTVKESVGDLAAADAAHRRAIAAQPDNPIGYRALARLKLRQGAIDDAEGAILSGLEALPENFDLGLERATIFERQGDQEAAIAEYERLYQLRPQSIVVANNLASLLSDFRDDEASLRRAAELAGRLRNSPIPHFQDTVGWVRYRSGDYHDAVATLMDVAEALPNEPLVRFHLGMAKFAVSDKDGAAAELAEALRLAEGRPFPQADLARETLAKAQSRTE